jgi:hypothetical protein
VSGRLLVTGSRDWSDVSAVDRVIRHHAPDALIHGAQRGLDAIAADVAFLLDVPVIEAYPAWWEWEGKAAGGLRNQRMLDQGCPDEAVAFPLPSSRGTWDMVRRCERAGVATWVADR